MVRGCYDFLIEMILVLLESCCCFRFFKCCDVLRMNGLCTIQVQVLQEGSIKLLMAKDDVFNRYNTSIELCKNMHI